MLLTYDHGSGTLPWAHEQADLYERSGGVAGAELNGKPVIIVTSVGARTGQLRKTPLIRVEHDGQYAVVAAAFGAPRNPAWYHNLAANPRVELQDGPVKKGYLAREVHGAERFTWWERAVEVWPAFAEAQTKTDRTFPVFVLTPIDA